LERGREREREKKRKRERERERGFHLSYDTRIPHREVWGEKSEFGEVGLGTLQQLVGSPWGREDEGPLRTVVFSSELSTLLPWGHSLGFTTTHRIL
jgi:hypothetical protein